jgi:hypothetical protein
MHRREWQHEKTLALRRFFFLPTDADADVDTHFVGSHSFSLATKKHVLALLSPSRQLLVRLFCHVIDGWLESNGDQVDAWLARVIFTRPTFATAFPSLLCTNVALLSNRVFLPVLLSASYPVDDRLLTEWIAIRDMRDMQAVWGDDGLTPEQKRDVLTAIKRIYARTDVMSAALFQTGGA